MTCSHCSGPRTGVVTTIGTTETVAWAPVCGSPSCVEEAMSWVRRMSRRAAYHVKDQES